MSKLGELSYSHVEDNANFAYPMPSKNFNYNMFFDFIIFGIGPSWLLPSILFQEVPFFQKYQPERLCVSAFMNLSVNIGSVLAMCIVLLIHIAKKSLHPPFVIPLLLTAPCIASFSVAAFYGITIGNVSLFIYFACIVGGFVGSLSAVVMTPFMTVFGADYISAYRSGSSGGMFLASLCSFIQNIAFPTTKLSATIFLMIFSCIFILPLIAYPRLITHYRTRTDYGVIIRAQENVNTISDSGNSPTAEDENSEKNMCPPTDNGYSHMTTIENLSIPSLLTTKISVTDCYRKSHYRFIYLLITIALLSFQSWGLLPAFLPFVLQDVAPSNCSSFKSIGIAYNCASLALVLGDLSTMYFQLPSLASIVLFTVSNLFIFILFIFSHFIIYHLNVPNILYIIFVIFMFAISRFLTAHILTSTFRMIASASELSQKSKELASRLLGIVDVVSTTLGVFLSTLLVRNSAMC